MIKILLSVFLTQGENKSNLEEMSETSNLGAIVSRMTPKDYFGDVPINFETILRTSSNWLVYVPSKE